MHPPPGAPGTATISQIIDALVTYDGPMLDHRFSVIFSRHPDAAVRESLLEVPPEVIQSAHLTRRAAHEWERVSSPVILEDAVRNAERLLLRAFLDGAESQIRLKAALARDAPTRDVRDLLESAISAHRNVTQRLRDALGKVPEPRREDASAAGDASSSRFTQAEGDDLRGQVESAIRRMRDAGNEPREVNVSHVALRHLRDQGCFRDGETHLLGVPVTVDLAWEASEFALHSYESVTLEEIVRESGGGRSGGN